MKLIIGNRNYSSWSLRPWMLMSYFGLDFEVLAVSLFITGSTGELEFDPELKEKLRAFSPSCKVPVLIDQDSCGNEVVLWDSLAICEYISECYLDGKGWPDDIFLRAKARTVTAEMHSSFSALRGALPMDISAKIDQSISDEANADIQRVLEIWNACLEESENNGPWLFGDFSIADCFYAPVVTRFLTYNIQVSERVKAYMNQVMQSQPMQAWLEAISTEQAR